MKIPKRIFDEIDTVALMMEGDMSWLKFKKAMLLSLPSEMRAFFSTRDDMTKQQRLNEFELVLIDIYRQRTGVSLVLEVAE